MKISLIDNKTSVAFHTLGCKLNFSETSILSRKIEDKGLCVTNFESKADIYVLNTCSVTEFADKKCRKIVKQVKRRNPKSKVVVIGCYAQLKPEEIAQIPGVNLVLGAAEKFRLVEFLEEISLEKESIVLASEISCANTFESAYSYGDRTRTFLKVQDGCNYSCSFCTIPQARGKSRSDTIKNVLTKIEEIEALGVKEIVLTGVNLGDFGNGTEVIEGLKQKKEALFLDLIQAIENHIKSIKRVRISSIEPNLVTEGIIDFVASSKYFLPHFHIPLQSGNNKQLKTMRRRYLRELYANRIDLIKKRMPHACIGADVIVGFPGETDDDFLETYRFLETLNVDYLHVFTFSARDNTPASTMVGQVPLEKRKKRNEILRQLSEDKKNTFYKKHIGSTRPILIEPSKQNGFVNAFTDNYIKVQLPDHLYDINTISHVTLNPNILI